MSDSNRRKFAIFQVSLDDGDYGEDLPVAVAIRMDAALRSKISDAVDLITAKACIASSFPLEPDSVRWLKNVCFDEDGKPGAITGWYDPDKDDCVNLYDDDPDEDHDTCAVHSEMSSPVIEVKRVPSGFLLYVDGKNAEGATYSTYAPEWSWDSFVEQFGPPAPPAETETEAGHLRASIAFASGLHMARILAQAGLMNPVSYFSGDGEIMEWAQEFTKMPGACVEQLPQFALDKAAAANWVATERVESIQRPSMRAG